MKRAIFLATAALLAMLILVPMALAQDTTIFDGATIAAGGAVGGNFGTTVIDGIAPGSPAPTPPTGGPSMLLPVASLLLGSGILTYAILRRR